MITFCRNLDEMQPLKDTNDYNDESKEQLALLVNIWFSFYGKEIYFLLPYVRCIVPW